MFQELAPNLWRKQYSLKLLGLDQQRVVTLVRLNSGAVVVHSTAPFSPEDVTFVRSVGTPAWMVEALLLHDTFAKEGRAAFPEATYLAPEGFEKSAGVPTQPLLPPPAEWADELEVVRLEGMPMYEEHLFFHRASRTLIVGDLLFHFHDPQTVYEKVMRRGVMGLTQEASTNRVFAHMVRDRAAFQQSVQQVMAWDFERIVVGHGDVVERGGKRVLEEALRRRGLWG